MPLPPDGNRPAKEEQLLLEHGVQVMITEAGGALASLRMGALADSDETARRTYWRSAIQRLEAQQEFLTAMAINLGEKAVIRSLRRSKDAPSFQIDLDRLAGKPARGGAMLFNPLLCDVILLQVWRYSVWYTETASGEAILSLLDCSLPESVCAAVAGAGMHLEDVIEVDPSAFFPQGNPRVNSVRNQAAGRHVALTISLQVEYSQQNWGVLQSGAAASSKLGERAGVLPSTRG